MTDDARDPVDQSRQEEVDKELLTVKQYAARFGVHVQTVYSAIRYGRRLQGAVVRPTSRTIRIAVLR